MTRSACGYDEQTRQGKEVAIGQAARNVVADFQSLWSTLGEDREKTRLIRIGANDWSQLVRNEQMIVHVFFTNAVRTRIAERRSEPDQLPPAWTDTLPRWRLEPGDTADRS